MDLVQLVMKKACDGPCAACDGKKHVMDLVQLVMEKSM